MRPSRTAGDATATRGRERGGTTVELRLLGGPALLRGGRSQSLGTQKSLATLCFLAACGDAVPRDRLSTLLWPDSDEDRARRSLRGELTRLRSALPNGVLVTSRLEVWLDFDAVDVDVRRFRTLVAEERDAEAAHVFRGPFCESLTVRAAEPFDEWLRDERYKLETAYVQVLRRLIRKERADGNLDAVLEWARRGIAFQPLNEHFYVQAMEAAEESGDRPGVLKIYRDLHQALRTELGIGPGAEARAVARRVSEGVRGEIADFATPVRRDSTTFVGHSAELNMLRGHLHQAMRGAGSVIFVHGPAGVGKTRLVAEVVGDRRAVWCTSQRSASNVAYFPIAVGLSEFLAKWGVPPVKEVWLREAARVCPELNRAGHNTSLGAPQDKVRLVEGLAATLAGAAGRGGMLVFDQIESADPDTVAVLGDLIQKLSRLPLVLAVISRGEASTLSTEVADLLAAAAKRGQLTDLPVGDLTRDEVRALVRGMIGANGSESTASGSLAELCDLIFEVLGGNPFSAVECARLTFDTSPDGPPAPFSAIRSGIPDVVRARVAGLPQRLRRLTEAAATAGDPVDPDLFSRMLDIGPWEIADALDELIVRRLLVSQRGVLRFAHHLIAEVIYDSLPPAKREILHARAAQALIAANSLNLDAVSGRIATHFEAAGQYRAAIPYHERAAENARKTHAHQTAIHHYQRLRELTPPKDQVPLLLRLGEVVSYGTTMDAEAIYRDALNIATLQGAGRDQAQCYFALGVLSRRQADLSASRHALLEAIRRFEIYGDVEGTEKTLQALTYAHIQEGDLSAAIASATKAAKIARDTGRIANLGGAQLSRGIAYLYGGNYVAALEAFEQARDIGLDTGDELAQAEALRYLSAVYGADGGLGTPEQAWASAERAIEICAGIGHRMGLARAADGMGGAYLVQGDWQRALDCYVAALSLTHTFGYAWGFDAMVYRVGYTLVQAGETDKGNHVLRQAVTLARNLNAPYWLCRALLALAELHAAAGDRAPATAFATDALDLARRLEHHDFISTARALMRNTTGELKCNGHRTTRGKQRSRGSESRYATLPDVPVILETPIHGPDDIAAWLDPIIDRLVAAGPTCS